MSLEKVNKTKKNNKYLINNLNDFIIQIDYYDQKGIKKYKNSMLANNSEALEASKKDVELAGHTRLSKYTRTTFSKTSLSLNKNPV